MRSIFTLYLLLILLGAFALRAYNLDYNSPFVDEAQYIVLGQKVLAGHWQEVNPFAWVGGMPLFYPTLAALAGNFGIVGARMLNVILGTIAVWLIYLFSRELRLAQQSETNEAIGLLAAAFLGILAIPLYLSRIAIYDMLSFTLLLAGLVVMFRGFSIETPKLWQRENLFFFAALFFFASFLAKYTTLLTFPIVVSWSALKARRIGREAAITCLRYFAFPLAAATAAYIFWNSTALLHFQREQVADLLVRRGEILDRFLYFTLPLVPLAFLGALMVFRRRAISTSALLIGALSVPLVHVLTNNLRTANQHSFLSIIFLLPLAAYPLALLWTSGWLVGRVIVGLGMAGILFWSQPQIRALENEWPNTNEAMNYLRAVTTPNDRIFSSEDDVTVLALPATDPEKIIGPFSFSYKDITDPAEAYRTAIADGYFDFALVNEESEVEPMPAIRAALQARYLTTYRKPPFVFYQKNND